MTPNPPDEAREALSADELRDVWPLLSPADRVSGWSLLPKVEAEDLFFGLSSTEQAELLAALPPPERRSWIRQLPPDDAADLVQAAAPEERDALLALLDEPTRKEVTALMAYAEDHAGGLMSPRFVRVRPDMTVDEAASYMRKQARAGVETIYYGYVLDAEQRLLGVVSFRDLFAAPADKLVRDIMRTEGVVKATDEMDQEALSRLFAQHDLTAVPVVDASGRMKGVVTVDDIVDVVQEEATEDIQKLGGQEALDEPYLQIDLWKMVKKRAGWLVILFLGEMLTATAMAHFEEALARAIVLTLFIPLIISSGGNSGSQATTLVIRAMALGEVKLRDWWRVMRRELASGLALGVILGSIGCVRILVWPSRDKLYGEHFLSISIAVGLSVVGVVLWGAIAGSMLPMILRRFGLDPASASAPFVATLVDVTGLIIYFSTASVILSGSLLSSHRPPEIETLEAFVGTKRVESKQPGSASMNCGWQADSGWLSCDTKVTPPGERFSKTKERQVFAWDGRAKVYRAFVDSAEHGVFVMTGRLDGKQLTFESAGPEARRITYDLSTPKAITRRTEVQQGGGGFTLVDEATLRPE
jgi:magnesium transporter